MTIQTPIAAHAAQILRSVRDYGLTVILGPTGSGKSTELGPSLYPEFRLAETQPRRLPARNVATYVAEKMNSRLGDIVGWRTGDGGETSNRTRIEFVTDGLLLKRLISGHLRWKDPNMVYALDEVRERSVIIDVLTAMLRRAKLAGAKFKVVLMSAADR